LRVTCDILLSEVAAAWEMFTGLMLLSYIHMRLVVRRWLMSLSSW
jgi:hypothetical protein